MKTVPNILFLYTDEQRADTLACYGNKHGIMPNLDRFAQQATVFDLAYCTHPVCTPSRGSIHTGLFSHAHGAYINNIRLNPDAKCLPEYMPPGAYATGHFGKWHLGDEIFPQHGFTDWRGTEDTYHATYSPPRLEFGPERSTYHHWLLKRGIKPAELSIKKGDPKWHPAFENRFFREQIHHLPEEASRPAFLADQSIEFIKAHKGRPWMLYVNFLEPHPPYNSCRDKQYAPADVALAPNWKEELSPDSPLRQRLRSQKQIEEKLREVTARYWGMCSLIDTHVGRMLKLLDELSLRDNTIVVFTTDHGDMMGDFGMGGKDCMFNGSARVPLLISLPGQREQKRVADPVSQVDLTPTLLELAGQPAPRKIHGASLAPVLTGKEKSPGRDVFIQWETGPVTPPKTPKLKPGQEKLGTPEQIAAANQERIRTIVTRDHWKFCRNGLGVHELYDLTNDPAERQNLASNAAHKDRIADLQQRITTWQKQVGDPG